MPYFCTPGCAFSFSTPSLIMFFIAVTKNDLSTASPQSTGVGRDLGGLLASVSQEKGWCPPSGLSSLTPIFKAPREATVTPTSFVCALFFSVLSVLFTKQV